MAEQERAQVSRQLRGEQYLSAGEHSISGKIFNSGGLRSAGDRALQEH
jgi:hypothetical protein